MPKTEEQFEEIRYVKKKLIMESALNIFAINGYDNTSISEIAKSAGISKGLMYNSFASKDNLHKAILLSGLENFMHHLKKEIKSLHF